MEERKEGSRTFMNEKECSDRVIKENIITSGFDVSLVWMLFVCTHWFITVLAWRIHLCSDIRVFSWPWLFLDHQLSGTECSPGFVVLCTSSSSRNGPILLQHGYIFCMAVQFTLTLTTEQGLLKLLFWHHHVEKLWVWMSCF